MIGVRAGIIDADYRGEVKVLLFNHGKQSFFLLKMVTGSLN
jgi:dUTPase